LTLVGGGSPCFCFSGWITRPRAHDGAIDRRCSKVKFLGLRKILGISLVVFLTIAVYIGANYRTCYAHPETIAKWLEKEMPLGSSHSQVKAWLVKEKGFRSVEERETGMFLRFEPSKEPVGVRTLEAQIGKCIVGFQKTTVGYWMFDENDRLIKVYVASYVDAI
jgi:hypothetical protein